VINRSWFQVQGFNQIARRQFLVFPDGVSVDFLLGVHNRNQLKAPQVKTQATQYRYAIDCKGVPFFFTGSVATDARSLWAYAMARPLRLDIEDAWYHVINRGPAETADLFR
jgi:hypothetical protein